MSILITGGAGYIGSHSAKQLSAAGRLPIALDNLRSGRRSNVRWGPLLEGGISDVGEVRRLLRDWRVSAVLHLAGSTHAGESMQQAGAYFRNNFGSTLTILEAMAAEGVRRLVFASTCAVYGCPAGKRAREQDAPAPLSPYGESKLMVERALPWYEQAHGLRWVALRYFNAAGGDGDLGESIDCPRLIPRAVAAALAGGAPIEIFGGAYPTADGAAVRDYVHVTDIARANALALDYLEAGGSSAVLNIASGVGVSVREILTAVGAEVGRPAPFRESAPRPGDPARIIADVSKARKVLGWEPRADLREIVASAIESWRLQAARCGAAG